MDGSLEDATLPVASNQPLDALNLNCLADDFDAIEGLDGLLGGVQPVPAPAAFPLHNGKSPRPLSAPLVAAKAIPGHAGKAPRLSPDATENSDPAIPPVMFPTPDRIAAISPTQLSEWVQSQFRLWPHLEKQVGVALHLSKVARNKKEGEDPQVAVNRLQQTVTGVIELLFNKEVLGMLAAAGPCYVIGNGGSAFRTHDPVSDDIKTKGLIIKAIDADPFVNVQNGNDNGVFLQNTTGTLDADLVYRQSTYVLDKRILTLVQWNELDMPKRSGKTHQEFLDCASETSKHSAAESTVQCFNKFAYLRQLNREDAKSKVPDLKKKLKVKRFEEVGKMIEDVHRIMQEPRYQEFMITSGVFKDAAEHVQGQRDMAQMMTTPKKLAGDGDGIENRATRLIVASLGISLYAIEQKIRKLTPAGSPSASSLVVPQKTKAKTAKVLVEELGVLKAKVLKRGRRVVKLKEAIQDLQERLNDDDDIFDFSDSDSDSEIEDAGDVIGHVAKRFRDGDTDGGGHDAFAVFPAGGM